MDIHKARTEAIHKEIIAKIDAHEERMGSSMNDWRKEMTPTKKCRRPVWRVKRQPQWRRIRSGA
jgi:hypothetical protein